LEEISPIQEMSSARGPANGFGAKRKRKRDEESSDSDSADDERALEEAAVRMMKKSGKTGVYNRPALLQRLADITDKLDWVETLDYCGAPLDVEDAEDDLKREVAFYNLALDSVKVCSAKLKALNEPYKRPEDYFAEMVKSDKHMARIKDQLIFEQRKMAAFEMRKQQQQQQKRSKQVESEKVRQRDSDKKQTLDAVKQWRKTAGARKGQLDDDDGFEQIINAKPKAVGTKKADLPAKGAKRIAKDTKFGFGGKKRFAKTNDTKSYDEDNFNIGKMRAGKSLGAAGGKKGKKGARRPGKEARAASRR